MPSGSPEMSVSQIGPANRRYHHVAGSRVGKRGCARRGELCEVRLVGRLELVAPDVEGDLDCLAGSTEAWVDIGTDVVEAVVLRPAAPSAAGVAASASSTMPAPLAAIKRRTPECKKSPLLLLLTDSTADERGRTLDIRDSFPQGCPQSPCPRSARQVGVVRHRSRSISRKPPLPMQSGIVRKGPPSPLPRVPRGLRD